MKTENFLQIVRAITKRDFLIDTTDEELLNEKEYLIYKILPITDRKVGFVFKTPKVDEKILKAFITAFTSKYREPDPQAYKPYHGDERHAWENMNERKREEAHHHHASNMFYKTELLKQVEANFNEPGIEAVFLKYGFYSTNYGIGVFCFWFTKGIENAISEMKNYLNLKNIPFTNEFSDAKWVYRFKLNLDKNIHEQILNNY